MAPPPEVDRSGIDAAEAELNASRDKVSQARDKVESDLGFFVDRVNYALPLLAAGGWSGGPLAFGGAMAFGAKLQDAAGVLAANVVDLLEKVRTILDQSVPIVSMIIRAFDWLKNVHAPVVAMSDTAAQYVLDVNHWSGPAKEVYDQRVPIQVKGIDGFADAASDMSKWLVELAAANAAYLLSLFQPLFDIGGHLVSAAGKMTTLVGALEAIGSCGDAVHAFVMSLYNAAEKGVGHVMTIINKMADAEKATGDLGDSWPQMVNL